MSTPPEPRGFRLPVAYGLRALGGGCMLLAVAVLLFTVGNAIGWLDSVPVVVLCALVGGVALLLTVVGAGLAVARPRLLSMDADGLRNLTGRSVGARTIGWRDIVDVAWTPDEGGPVLQVTLADGRRSRIRTSLLNADPVTIENALRTRADHAFGYRPV